MGKSLVLAEKPSVGKEIAQVLNCNEKRNGYFEGGKYIVTWALGHLVTLADPDIYNNKYANWNLEDLPIIPSPMKLIVIKNTSKQHAIVQNLIGRSDVDEVIIATDAGREGELVARWIIEKSKIRKPLKRLWISSITRKAILEGFNKLKPGKEYDNLYAAATARAESDWIVGINATRALTTKYNAQLSCGRVQTPTVAIVAQREDEIRQFVPEEFYGIQAFSSSLNLTWHDSKSNDTKSFSSDYVNGILDKISGHTGKVESVDSKIKKIYSSPLYDLTELQRDAYNSFGYSAKKTLSVMQSLYEKHKVLTYPRTDSRYLTEDIVDTIPERLKAINISPYKAIAFDLQKNQIKASRLFVDNSKVSDHHAIIPTEEAPFPGSLSFDERNIYELVVKRFLSVLMPPFEFEEKTLKIKINGENFSSKGIKILKNGWKIIDNNEIKDNILPDIKKDSQIIISKFNKTSGETKPPSYFNEGSILTAMENPTKFMPIDDRNLNRIIGETGGLGTVATRADIIEKIFSTQLIELKGKNIHITNKGRQLLNLVPEELKSPLLTAEWEQKLNLISQGKLDKNIFIKEMKSYTHKIIEDIKKSSQEFKYDNLSTTKCPDCNKVMLEINTKSGKSLVCQDRNCGHRINISRTTNARCPNCHKNLDLIGSKEDQKFVCKNCGYKEKLSSFEKRKNESNSKGGKKDFQNFKTKLQKMEKEAELADNPFAALADLNLNVKPKK